MTDGAPDAPDAPDSSGRGGAGRSSGRRRRRAVGGTPLPDAGGAPSSRPVSDDPFGRSADDTDAGWGDPAGGEPDDPDERLRREVPPHW